MNKGDKCFVRIWNLLGDKRISMFVAGFGLAAAIVDFSQGKITWVINLLFFVANLYLGLKPKDKQR